MEVGIHPDATARGERLGAAHTYWTEKKTRELLISVRWERGLSAEVLRWRDIRLMNVDKDERHSEKEVLWDANRNQSCRDDQAKGRASTRYKSL